MLKDRAQKAMALRLSISKRWLPQIEVEIEPSQRIEKTKSPLTDIDVLAVAPSAVGGHTRLVFDCKSGLRESAIGRAFWLHGVMTRASAQHGFVILNEKVNVIRDHRVSASDLNITLLHQTEIEDLAQGIGGSTLPTNALIASMDCWEQFLAIGSKYNNLSEYLIFSRSSFWMIKNSGEQCRKTVQKLRSVSSELDPSKKEHLAVFADALCLFLLALSELSNKLFLVLLRPASQADFSSSLLAFLYGGYESLETAIKIRKVTSVGDSEEAMSLFPEIKRLEHLVREILQAPQQALSAAILAREMGFEALEGTTSNFKETIAQESPYTPKFVLLGAEYLQKAARLPPEFSATFTDLSLDLLSSLTSRAIEAQFPERLI
ncbi:hypothetical protein [Pseudomonas frederiksbergensis]|uniref:hypothetical protein n=1 Tax=Pseudomonas frederiksbergensis TaxID=104087 RepID=UPI0011CEC752|nr:hypothetical protein [Pseudomonas frederiksbergensis]